MSEQEVKYWRTVVRCWKDNESDIANGEMFLDPNKLRAYMAAKVRNGYDPRKREPGFMVKLVTYACLVFHDEHGPEDATEEEIRQAYNTGIDWLEQGCPMKDETRH